MRPGIAALLLGAAAVAAGACGSDGRTLRPPSDDQTTTTAEPPADLDAAGDDELALQPLVPDGGALPGTEEGPEPEPEPAGPTPTGAMVLTGVFAVPGILPVDATCDGAGASPPLAWTGVDPATVELALTIEALDDAEVLWAVAGINPASTGVAVGEAPPGAVVATNDRGETAYGAPCPVPGAPSAYELTLWALPEPSGVAPGDPAREVRERLRTAATDVAPLVVTLTR